MNLVWYFFVCAYSFSMFYSPPPYHDLIFQDATRQLQAIPREKRAYDKYLGSDFMRAKRITDCHSGARMPTTGSTIVFSMLCCSFLAAIRLR